METSFDWIRKALDNWRVGFLLLFGIGTCAFEAAVYLVAIVFVQEFFLDITSISRKSEYLWLYVGLFAAMFPYFLGRRLPALAKEWDENLRPKPNTES